jgi:outer membrane protein
MDGEEDMNYAASVCWLFSGIIFAATDAYAQDSNYEAGQRVGQEIHDQTGIDATEKLLRDAEVLMKDGKSADAYKLLEPFEFDRSGEVRFDYLIGIAALDSGMPDKATLAFERVLAEEPDYAGARLELARAYYQLGDTPRAKTEFETVLGQNPSAAARATIQKYLEDIAGQETGKRTFTSGYIEGTVGRDTNVNNASESSDNIFIPTPNPFSIELADNYFGMAAGGEVIHSLSANFRMYAGADMVKRNNLKYKSFNSFSHEERMGMIYGTGVDQYRLGLSGGQFSWGGAPYSNNSGLSAEWRHAAGDSDQLNIFGQYVRYRYANIALQTNDINQQFAGFGWLHESDTKKTMLYGSLYFGTENDVGPATLANPDGGRPDGAKRMGGFRVGGEAIVAKNAKLYFIGGEQFGRFEEVNPAIFSQRSDQLDDFTFGMNWYFGKPWIIRAQFTRIYNMSNVEAYAYDRSDYSLTLRRNFN